MAFAETTWMPDEMTFWATGGRGWKTTIVETYGGDEFRNQAWTRTKGVWSLNEALRSTNPLSAYYFGIVSKFPRTLRGMFGGFRFRDWQDYQNDDAGGSGVMVAAGGGTYQMYKRYTLDGITYDQIIYKPRAAYGSYAGITFTGGSGTLDYATGILSAVTGTPTAWAGRYDVPVRFDSDIPDIGILSDGTYYNWNDLRVVELKNLS
jgi:uncharacterized protein (TIGR02217 family)